jgi:hypothetical protein
LGWIGKLREIAKWPDINAHGAPGGQRDRLAKDGGQLVEPPRSGECGEMCIFFNIFNMGTGRRNLGCWEGRDEMRDFSPFGE